MTATGIRDVVTDANRFKRLLVSPPCQAKSRASETTFSSWHYIPSHKLVNGKAVLESAISRLADALLLSLRGTSQLYPSDTDQSY